MLRIPGTHPKSRFTILVLLAYLLVGPLLEIEHTDGYGACGSATMSYAFSAARNVHRQPQAEGRHDCLACFISAARMAVPVSTGLVVGGLVSVSPYTPLFDNAPLTSPAQLFPAKRGPPTQS